MKIYALHYSLVKVTKKKFEATNFLTNQQLSKRTFWFNQLLFIFLLTFRQRLDL